MLASTIVLETTKWFCIERHNELQDLGNADACARSNVIHVAIYSVDRSLVQTL